MSRAVYIGGFGNGKMSAEAVGVELARYYDNVDLFTFSEATSRPDTIRRAVRAVDTFTHSGGMLALTGSSPRRIEAFGAPLPSTKPRLLGKTLIKMARMHTPGIGIRSLADLYDINAYNISAAAELMAHPKGNLGRLGAIACFDAVEAATAAVRSGIPATLTYADGDEYFKLSAAREAEAAANDVGVVRMPGIHDQLVIRPAATLVQAGVPQRIGSK